MARLDPTRSFRRSFWTKSLAPSGFWDSPLRDRAASKSAARQPLVWNPWYLRSAGLAASSPAKPSIARPQRFTTRARRLALLGSGRPRTFRFSLVLALVIVVASAAVRWLVADLADWGVDQGANLWLGTNILDGQHVPLGLMSSRGISNLPGAPIIVAPFALLPDLLAISRAVSLLHLGALSMLAVVIWKTGGRLDVAVSSLVFFPALLFASSTIWNQYLAVLLTVAAIPLLLVVAGRRGDGIAQAAALVGLALVAVALPAVHLTGFVDLGVLAALVAAILTLRPRPIQLAVLGSGLVAVGVLAAAVYAPWFKALTAPGGVSVVAVAGLSAGGVGAVALLSWSIATIAPLLERTTFGSWLCAGALFLFAVVVAVLPFIGALVYRTVLLTAPAGAILFALQAGVVLSWSPGLTHLIRRCRRGTAVHELLERHFHSPTEVPALLM
jgi:hypothetical protein